MPKPIETLASKGRYSFASEAAREAVSPNASKLALNRLARQRHIASLARGFYVIIPPEYRSLGCLPAEQFIADLMKSKGLTYYAGLLTAAQYYGAAHQRSQEFQVFVQKNRRLIRCGKVRFKFIARKAIDDVPVLEFNTSRGELRASTPEGTAIGLAGYPENVGGCCCVSRRPALFKLHLAAARYSEDINRVHAAASKMLLPHITAESTSISASYAATRYGCWWRRPPRAPPPPRPG